MPRKGDVKELDGFSYCLFKNFPAPCSHCAHTLHTFEMSIFASAGALCTSNLLVFLLHSEVHGMFAHIFSLFYLLQINDGFRMLFQHLKTHFSPLLLAAETVIQEHRTNTLGISSCSILPTIVSLPIFTPDNESQAVVNIEKYTIYH